MQDLVHRMSRIRLIVTDVDGVLTDGKMWFDGEGRPFRAFYARDGLGIALWRYVDGKIAFVSGLASPAVETLAKQWRCCACLTNTRDKASACRQIASEQGLSLEEIAFIGDDVIDLNAMEIVGLAVAVKDAIEEARAAAHYVTVAPGGHGALREVVNRILMSRGKLEECIRRYREDHLASSHQ
ncbi:MAG: HAD hydrolase family protein [Candidatus Hydrogenedentales bacterium]